MAAKSLEERVDMLERSVEILEQLPARLSALETQFVQLRDEMRAEFSATRADARGSDERVIQNLREDIRTSSDTAMQTMREEIRTSGDTVMQTMREEIRTSGDTVMQTLRKEIRDGDEETRRFMRILHEEVVERIRLLGGRP